MHPDNPSNDAAERLVVCEGHGEGILAATQASTAFLISGISGIPCDLVPIAAENIIFVPSIHSSLETCAAQYSRRQSTWSG